MNNQILTKAINEYNIFRSEFENNISKDSEIRTNINKECYLIKEKWDKEFVKSINQNDLTKLSKNNFQENEYETTRLSKNSLPKKPEFILDIPSVIKNIENNCKLKLVSKKFILLLYKSEILLNEIPSIYYSAGKNKLILEFEEKENKDENNVLLIINPLEEICNYKIYSFTIKRIIPDKKNFYRKLLNENDISIDTFSIDKNNLITNKKEHTIKLKESIEKKKIY